MEPTQTDFRAQLQILWRGRWILLGCLVLIPLVVYLISSGQPTTYASSAVLQVQATSSTGVSATPAFLATEIAAEQRVIDSALTAQAAQRELNPPAPSIKALLSQVSATSDTTDDVITITASNRSPERAAEVANAFSTAFISQQTKSSSRQIAKEIKSLNGQLASLPKNNPTAKLQLQAQIEVLRTNQATAGNTVTVLQAAAPSSSPASPRPARDTALAFVVALLLGVGLVAIKNRLDRRVRDPLEVESLLGVPLLTVLPESVFSDEDTPQITEAFNTVRTNLFFSQLDRPLSTIVITSPAMSDGKTLSSIGLSRAIASAGKDVILVDADLRRSQMAERFGITVRAGLGAVLVGAANIEDALVDTEQESRGRLRVLPSGPPPPNPSQLIGSEQMQRLLSDLSAQAEYVVVDTPPLLVVADALPLITNVSATIVVSRVGRASRNSFVRLRRMIEAANGNMIGVIGTGIGPGRLYDYGYDYQQQYVATPAAESSTGHSNGLGQTDAPPELLRPEQSHPSASSPPRGDGQTNGTGPPGPPVFAPALPSDTQASVPSPASAAGGAPSPARTESEGASPPARPQYPTPVTNNRPAQQPRWRGRLARAARELLSDPTQD